MNEGSESCHSWVCSDFKKLTFYSLTPERLSLTLTNFYMHEKQYFRHIRLFCTALQHPKIHLITSSIVSGGGGGGDVKVATPPTLPLLDSLPFKGGKLRIIQKCCPNYPTLGIHLLNDDDGAEVKRIEMEKNFKPEPTMKAIFEEWLNTRKDCSWSIFITCLQKCNLNKLAKDVKDALIENRISF